MIFNFTNSDGFYSYEFWLHLDQNYVGITTTNSKNDGSVSTGIEIKNGTLDFGSIHSTRYLLHLSDEGINFINRILKLKAFW